MGITERRNRVVTLLVGDDEDDVGPIVARNLFLNVHWRLKNTPWGRIILNCLKS